MPAGSVVWEVGWTASVIMARAQILVGGIFAIRKVFGTRCRCVDGRLYSEERRGKRGCLWEK